MHTHFDTAHAVLVEIFTSVDGKTPAEYIYKRKDQVVALGMKSSVKIDWEQVRVDPQFLFQRLIAYAQTSEELESPFKYELCSCPPAIFDSSLQLREAQKPVFADAICDLFGSDVPANILNDGKQVCSGWWDTSSPHFMVSWIYLHVQRYMPLVH